MASDEEIERAKDIAISLKYEVDGLSYRDKQEHIRKRVSEMPSDIRDIVEHLTFVGMFYSPEEKNLSQRNQIRSDRYLAAFGFFVLITSVIIAILLPAPTEYQAIIFRIYIALGAGALGALIPGFLSIDIKWAKAGGALAVFLLVYVFDPASSEIPPNANSRISEGDN